MLIKIFNINTFLLPFYLSKHNRKRRKKLVSFIKNKKPDIITLQEVTQTRSIRYLEKHLPDYYFTHNTSRRMNRSGLVTLSKKKPEKVKFYPFSKNPAMNWLDRLSKRGVIRTDFGNISVYNTHLYHKTRDFRIKITLAEFDYVKKIINKNKICLLCGDLNLNKEQFDEANNKFFKYVDSFEDTFSFDNPYLIKWWDRKVVGNVKIDYVLIRNPTMKKITFKSKTIKEPEMSDHYGIYSEIKLL